MTTGVYTSATSISVTGILTLDAENDPDAVFIFQAGSTLTTASGSEIRLINGARFCRVFWQVGSSATLGTGSIFKGHILAMESITATNGTVIQGQLLARTGAVTLDTNTITNGICADAIPPQINVVKTPNTFVLPFGGGTVGYTYTVTNPGTVDLSDVTVTDDKVAVVTYVSGDTNSDSILQATETWIYSGSQNITLTTINIVTAQGRAGVLTAIDTATVTVVVSGAVIVPPLINVVKTANLLSLPYGGGTVEYTYNVTNPGTVPLSNVTVSDDKVAVVTYVSGDTNSDNLLQATETWIFTGTQSLSVTTTNIVTAQGQFGGMTATDTATVTVIVSGTIIYPPLINVVKTAYPLSLPSGGGSVTYTYRVTNPGNVALSNISLTDDKLASTTYVSGDSNNDGLMQTTETWNYTATTTVTTTTTNVATASGTANGMTSTDTANATVIVSPTIIYPPLINVVKTATPMFLSASGGDVTYTYRVTNPGVVTLNNVSVSDDMVSPVNYISGDINADNLLQPGEMWIYRSYDNITGSTTNTATAIGHGNGMSVSDTSVVTVVLEPVYLYPPLINVVKTPQPLSLPEGGGSVTYTYRVTNPGVVTLNNVTLTDDLIDSISYISGDVNSDNLLQPSETWIYRASDTITVATTNTATATGHGNGMTVSDTSVATVTLSPVHLYPPLINVVKTQFPVALASGGGLVTYTYKVTNPGVVTLNNVNLVDDKIDTLNYISGDVNSDNLLQPSEIWIYRGTDTIIGTTTNKATVTGHGNDMTATDDSYATVIVAKTEETIPGGEIPATATHWYTILLIGAVFVLLALVSIKFRRTNE